MQKRGKPFKEILAAITIECTDLGQAIDIKTFYGHVIQKYRLLAREQNMKGKEFIECNIQEMEKIIGQISTVAAAYKVRYCRDAESTLRTIRGSFEENKKIFSSDCIRADIDTAIRLLVTLTGRESLLNSH